MPTDPAEGSQLWTLRDLMVTAGLEVLERDGLGLGSPTLGYTKVFDHLEREHGVRVTRASVHERIWPSHADFRRDVLAQAMTHLPANPFGTRADELRDAILGFYARGLTTRERVAEFSRMFAPRSYETMLSYPAFVDVQMAKAMASPFNDRLAADVLQGPLRARVDAMLGRFYERLTVITGSLGLVPVDLPGPARTSALALFGTMLSNLVIGTVLDVAAGAADLVAPIELGGVPTSDREAWTVLGVGLHGYLTLLFTEQPPGPHPGPVTPPPRATPPPGPMTDLPVVPGRRRREELRELVLAAGVEVLLKERLTLQPESLAYASVFEHIEATRGLTIHRGSIHNRIWASHDEYWLEVLCRAIHDDQPIDPVIPPLAPSGDPTTDRQIARDTVRITAAADVATCLGSTGFLRRQAVKAALLAEPASPRIDALRGVIRDQQDDHVQRRAVVLLEQLGDLGFEVRAEAGIDETAAARIASRLALTTTTGVVFDQSVGVEAVTRPVPIERHPGGPVDIWTTSGLATWAVVDLLFHRPGAPTGWT